jgi:hypothetical protein
MVDHRIVGVPADLRNEILWNTNQSRYNLSQLIPS